MGQATAEAPDVSVIVCHHTNRLIDRCLDSIRLSVGVTYEVIVITSDDTYSTKDAEVYFLEDGPAGKRNLGAKYAKGNLLVFLDDDVEISPYCLYEFKVWMEEHPTCGMAFGRIYKMAEGRRQELDDCGSWLTWTGFLFARAQNRVRDCAQFNAPVRILASKSATCSIRRSTFQLAGRFDADYFILGEETDLAWRVWLSGLEVWYVPTAVSWHAFGCFELKPKNNFYTIERTMTYGCRNYLSMLWTNLGTWRLLLTFPTHLCAWLCAALGFCASGDANRGMAIMRGMSEFCHNLPDLQRKRHRVQSNRVVSDQVLFQSIYYSPRFSYYLKRMWRYWNTQLHGVILLGFLLTAST